MSLHIDLTGLFSWLFRKRKKKNKDEDEYVEDNGNFQVSNEEPKEKNVREGYPEKFISQLLKERYPQYKVANNVSYTDKNWNSYIKINKALYIEDKLEAVIIIIEEKDEKSHVYNDLKSYCQKHGTIFINFYRRMSNKEEYVEKRIAELLR